VLKVKQLKMACFMSKAISAAAEEVCQRSQQEASRGEITESLIAELAANFSALLLL